ncbi:DUF6527 family protein [Sphingomonas sp.]|uniref:DUF6527 family protein n=1 Tax=Sphingomonas sp. TaxID=28214 RepID=UPI003CC693C9
MPYVYRAVERLPKQLDDGVVYHSEDFEVAALLCACGCGHRVSLLVPDSHRVWSEDGLATITPSISVCDGACRSHYFITAGEVEMWPAFSDTVTRLTMRRQIARHAAIKVRPLRWRDRVRNAATTAVRAIMSRLQF